jgi:NAD(P)-dependent dehydrogenase (short-subunit alcohol dehydrogenase family)
MQRRGGGRIVNIGSIYGTVAVDPRLYENSPDMIAGSVPYVASKSALVTLTRDLAVRLAPHGVQVNMVSPGGVRAHQPEAFQQAYRQRTPQGRLAEPADVAGAVSFLASDDAAYITGQNLIVDGGFTSW